MATKVTKDDGDDPGIVKKRQADSDSDSDEAQERDLDDVDVRDVRYKLENLD